MNETQHTDQCGEEVRDYGSCSHSGPRYPQPVQPCPPSCMTVQGHSHQGRVTVMDR